MSHALMTHSFARLTLARAGTFNTAAVSPSATALTSTRSRSNNTRQTVVAFASGATGPPLSRWNSIDWSHTRASPHGTAVATQTKTAVATNALRLRPPTHIRTGTIAGNINGLVASAAPRSAPGNVARKSEGRALHA